MKIYFILAAILWFSCDARAISAPKDPKEAQAWYQKCQIEIEKWQSNPDINLKINHLRDYLIKFGSQMPNNPDSRWHDTYYQAQSALLSIPGHAQYFADKVERIRKTEERFKPEARATYNRWREWYLTDTLMHLPSPGTIQVLGHYLDDERDTPPPSDSSFLPENSFVACMALSQIGLRNPPVAKKPGLHNWRDALALQRVWYAKVKSGELAFSFAGQKMEYRFKPDGTWETITLINPPKDLPNSPVTKKSLKVIPFESHLSSASPTPPSDKLKWLLGGVGLLLVAACCVLMKTRKTS